MQICRFDPSTARSIDRFSSRFSIAPMLRSSQGGVQLACAYLGKDGLIGFHQATVPQLFAVVAGAGWVRGQEPERTPIKAGEAAFWTAGEWHEAGTDDGMTAMLIEGPGVDASLLAPIA